MVVTAMKQVDGLPACQCRETRVRHGIHLPGLRLCVHLRLQIVHTMQLVRGRPYYGYHEQEQLFIKIVL